MVTVEVDAEPTALAAPADRLGAGGAARRWTRLTVEQPSLEDVYLSLTGDRRSSDRDDRRHALTGGRTAPCWSHASSPSPAAARRRPAACAGAGPALLLHQIRYEQLTFWRNPQSAFFTFVFPVVVIAIFGGLFGGIDGERVLLRPLRAAVLRADDRRACPCWAPATASWRSCSPAPAADRHPEAGPGDTAAGLDLLRWVCWRTASW